MCCVDIRLHLQCEFLFIYPHSKSNDTDSNNNETLFSTTVKPTTPALPSPKPILPVQTGVKAQEEEQSSGLTIFFSLLVIGSYYLCCCWVLICEIICNCILTVIPMNI